MKYHTRITHSVTLDDDTEVDLEFKPEDYSEPLIHRVDNKLVVAYLVHDDDCAHPLDDADGMGKVIGRGKYETRNHGEHEMFEALGLNRYGDPDYEKVADEVNAAWQAYLKAQDGDFWSHVLDALGYPTPDPKNPDSIDDANSYMNALRDELVTTDIATEGSVYYAIWEADRYLTEFDISSDGRSNAAPLFQFDVEKIQHEMWVAACERGDIGDKDAVILDVYDHSGLHWSISGGGTQCRWDTSSGAGVWVPDRCARDEIDSRAWVYATYFVRETPVGLPGQGHKYQLIGVHPETDELTSLAMSDDWGVLWGRAKVLAALANPTPEQVARGRRRAAEQLAQQALDEYNAWLSGDCYGCVVETFQLVLHGQDNENPRWEQINQDSCWGFIGSDHAKESLQHEFFDGAVADLQAEALA